MQFKLINSIFHYLSNRNCVHFGAEEHLWCFKSLYSKQILSSTVSKSSKVIKTNIYFKILYHKNWEPVKTCF